MLQAAAIDGNNEHALHFEWTSPLGGFPSSYYRVKGVVAEQAMVSVACPSLVKAVNPSVLKALSLYHRPASHMALHLRKKAMLPLKRLLSKLQRNFSNLQNSMLRQPCYSAKQLECMGMLHRSLLTLLKDLNKQIGRDCLHLTCGTLPMWQSRQGDVKAKAYSLTLRTHFYCMVVVSRHA